DVCVERRSPVELAVREPAAALVVADERAPAAQIADPVPPDGASPLVVEVRHPVARLDERWSLAVDRVREPHAVERGAEAGLVPQGTIVAPAARPDYVNPARPRPASWVVAPMSRERPESTLLRHRNQRGSLPMTIVSDAIRNGVDTGKMFA